MRLPINFLRDRLGRRIPFHWIEGLAMTAQSVAQRIVLAQQGSMVKIFIDPGLHSMLEFTKFIDHVVLIEKFPLEYNLDSSVVTMQIPTGSVKIHQSMGVTKIDFFDNSIHENGRKR